MDHGSSGCQNARGIGPTAAAQGVQQLPGEPVVPGLADRTPAEAASIAGGMGHTVVFRVPIDGYGECWCVPPPEGTVTEAWWGQHGALWLTIEGVDEGHSAQNQPARGWGC
jgi:hypothetical protein